MITAFASREALMAAAADRLAAALEAGVKARGRACAALSGGSTPEPAYRLLAQRPLDWKKISFALVDERFVDPGDEGSNQAMLERALAPALEAGATLIPMYAPAGSVDEAAVHASAPYGALHYDIALMGMGEDGHTASWFPGGEGLEAALSLAGAEPVVAVRAPGAAGAAARLTLTRAEIAEAGRVVLLISGEAKRAKLQAALGGPIEAAPVAALFDAPLPPPEVLWAP